MSEIIDSYSESNRVSNYGVGIPTDRIAVGQTFTGQNAAVDSTVFYLAKSGNPTGNAYSKIYELTGTPGTDGEPTGTAIAISDAFDVASITTGLNTLVFSGDNRIVLIDGNYYGVSFEYNGGDISNKVFIAIDTSPSDDGNIFTYDPDTLWVGDNTYDMCFYVYGTEVIITPIVGNKYPLPPFKNAMV